MENFDANAGTNKLANVLSDRMRRENDTSLCLDFGEIQGNGSLITNTFPVAIPKGQYSVCRHVGGLSLQQAAESMEDIQVAMVPMVTRLRLHR